MDIHLIDEKDTFIWKLTESGQFAVRSLYAELLNGNTKFLRKYLWKIKVPLKIRIFMWFLNRKEILTKDNLAKRNWTGCKKCAFCDEEETIEHLFLKCKFARLIWRVVHFTFNMPPPTNIKNMFGNWLNGIDKFAKARIRIGVCGTTGMTLYLTMQTALPFCRLSTELHTGSTHGRSFFQRTSGDKWILDAHD
jgi:hypothetical protein